VLYSSSPDYAIIAQKYASIEITALFNEVFSKEYGITLESLSEKFQNHILNIENKALETENKAIELEKRLIETENKAIELEKRLIETENKIIELFTLYNGLLNSKSWKITYPLRLLGRFARWFKTGTIAWITFAPKSRPRRVTIKTITKTKEYLDKNPKLKSLVKFCLKPFPGLQDRLKEAGEDNKTISYDDNSTQIENSNLSSTARKIYNDLKKAIEERKKYENLD